LCSGSVSGVVLWDCYAGVSVEMMASNVVILSSGES
jgi:hypothetical protein